MKRKRPKLRIAEAVTREHGEQFAEGFFQWAWDTSSMFEAFESLDLMTWPRDGEAQELYQDIEDAICERTFEAVKPAIAEAFVRIASELLAREREAQRR